MKKREWYKKLCVMGLAGTVILNMAGCSSSSSGTGSSSASASTEDTASDAAASDAAATGDTVAETAQAAGEEYTGEVRKVVVGTGNDAAPFCYLDEDGNSIGYDIDVLKELDARLPQYEFDIQAMDFSTLVVSIDSGSVDMLAHELVQSDERKEKYLFPEQYYCLSPMSLAVTAESGITSMADMAGKTMELNPSQYEYQMVMAWNEAHPGQEVDLIGVTDQSTADNYLKVSSGKVDASLTYKATFDSVIPDIGVDNLQLTDEVMCEDTYLMFPQTEQQLCDDVNAVLKEMLEDGTLSEISLEWYGEDVFTLYSDMIQIVAD
ncbi:MAG: transporter substrate-binding domain-containing protein [Lachnospiraceae bacterium]|nr:transporter substrate-binding domain-containing protein [Lachnospiraceae bacterium]